MAKIAKSIFDSRENTILLECIKIVVSAMKAAIRRNFITKYLAFSFIDQILSN